MEKEMKLKTGWSLTKCNTGTKYMLTGSGVFIHGDDVAFGVKSKNGAWLNIIHTNAYIGSIWIDTADKVKEIKKFIKEA